MQTEEHACALVPSTAKPPLLEARKDPVVLGYLESQGDMLGFCIIPGDDSALRCSKNRSGTL